MARFARLGTSERYCPAALAVRSRARGNSGGSFLVSLTCIRNLASLLLRGDSAIRGAVLQGREPRARPISSSSIVPRQDPSHSALIRLIREEDLEQSVVAFDDWSRFAGSDIEGLFGQRSGAIPPTAAERREKRGGIGQAR